MSREVSDRTASTIPEELTGPTPRKVYLTGNLATGLTIIILLFLVGGAILLGWWGLDAIQQTQNRAALRINGRVTNGTVTGLTGSHGTHYVHYVFAVNTVRYFGKAQVSGPDPQKSDPIAIRYLPTDPSVNHPAAWEWSPLMQIMAVPFLLFLMGTAVWAIAHVHRERTLARNGKPANGVVTTCATQKGTFRIEYSFHTESGELMRGSSDCADRYEPGQNIWILYLPKNPCRNHAYPLEDYEIPG